MARSRETQDQQPLYGAAIPLARPVKLDREALREELRAVITMAGAGVRMANDAPKRGLLSSLTGQPDQVLVEIGGMKLTISSVPKPLCSPTAIHGFINPALWKSGIGGITNHKAHLMIAEAERFTGGSGRDAMFDRATAVTLAAAAVADLGGGEGVVWLPGKNAVPLSTFGSEMERFIDGQAPLLFWVRTQILPAPTQAEQEFGQLSGEALEPGIATSGLTAFIGAEIIAPPSHLDRDVVLDYIFALASLVIDENKDLSDGFLIGTGPNQMRVVPREHGQYSRRPYWELEPAKKPVARSVPRPVQQPQPVPQPSPAPQASPAYPSAPPPAGPSYPPMPDHGLGPNLGTLPKSSGALVDPEEVLRAAMSSSDPMDALPAALRPARPSTQDPNPRAVLGPDPAQAQGVGPPSSPAESDEALPAALRPMRPAPGTPPPMPPGPGEVGQPPPERPSAPPEEKPAARERPSAMGRRFAKRLPTPETPEHGSLGTDIPRPTAEERFTETPVGPPAEPEPEDDDSIAAKLRVVPGSRR